MTLDQLGLPTASSASAASGASRKLVREWQVHPAGEAQPALRHRFWQPDFARQPGSAQLHFSRALLHWHAWPAKFRQQIENWHAGDEPPTDVELEQAVVSMRNLYVELHALAMSEDDKLDHRLRELRGPEMYMYLLPEIQQSRSLARALALKIRYQISQGDFDGAVRSLQDGFRLATFIGQGETLVQQLVGIAIAGVMLDEAEELLQQPNSPNLYWALATLPRPLIDVNESLQFELTATHRIIPALEEAATSDHGAEYWTEAWGNILKDFVTLGGVDNDSKLAFAIIGAAAAEPAKQRLLAAGYDAERIESMPKLQAVLLDASVEIRHMGDDLAKANFLPGTLGDQLRSQAQRDLTKWIQEGQFSSAGSVLVGLLFPAVEAAASAGVRLQFRIDQLMTVEAIRMHAAAHNGKLPTKLDQLSPVPALPNPFSGGPFSYRVEERSGKQVAVLTAETPVHVEFLREIHLHLQAN